MKSKRTEKDFHVRVNIDQFDRSHYLLDHLIYSKIRPWTATRPPPQRNYWNFLKFTFIKDVESSKCFALNNNLNKNQVDFIKT